MEMPAEESEGRTGRIRGAFTCWTFLRKQVMFMDAYQIIMICIATVTLMLKLIEVFNGINRK